MKHRTLSVLLVCILLISILPSRVFATEPSCIINGNVILFDDGSYIERSTSELSTRTTNTKSGKATYNYRNSEGTLLWQAVLSGTFTYTGTTSTCTGASCSVTIYDSNWYQVSKSTSYSGNTATAQLTMGQKVLGVTISKPSYTLTLSCDANGNLS